MRFFAHLCAYATLIVGVGIGLFGLANFLRFDGQSNVSLLLFELRRSEALRYRSEAVIGHVTLKHATFREVVAGRLTLHEAVARFVEANQLVEDIDPDLVPSYQIPTTEKGMYQQVLAWMRAEAAHLPPERAERILASLEKDYESRFGPLGVDAAFPGANEQ